LLLIGRADQIPCQSPSVLERLRLGLLIGFEIRELFCPLLLKARTPANETPRSMEFIRSEAASPVNRSTPDQKVAFAPRWDENNFRKSREERGFIGVRGKNHFPVTVFRTKNLLSRNIRSSDDDRMESEHIQFVLEDRDHSRLRSVSVAIRYARHM